MRKRIEIESIKGLNHAGIAESEHESQSSDVYDVVDKAAAEKLERNFRRSDFYFDQDDSFTKHDDLIIEDMGEQRGSSLQDLHRAPYSE